MVEQAFPTALWQTCDNQPIGGVNEETVEYKNFFFAAWASEAGTRHAPCDMAPTRHRTVWSLLPSVTRQDETRDPVVSA